MTQFRVQLRGPWPVGAKRSADLVRHSNNRGTRRLCPKGARLLVPAKWAGDRSPHCTLSCPLSCQEWVNAYVGSNAACTVGTLTASSIYDLRATAANERGAGQGKESRAANTGPQRPAAERAA